MITGTALIDTDVLARTYDQRQWAHAFGPADLFVRSQLRRERVGGPVAVVLRHGAAARRAPRSRG